MAEEWSPLDNETLNPIKPDDVKKINFILLIKTDSIQLWNKQRLYASAEDATVFLGVLDAAFMFSYATVSE